MVQKSPQISTVLNRFWLPLNRITVKPFFVEFFVGSLPQVLLAENSALAVSAGACVLARDNTAARARTFAYGLVSAH